MRSINPITRFRAERHEALFLRIEALIKQVEATAIRRPNATIPDLLKTLAEDALFEARRFSWHRPGRKPSAAPDFGGLGAQLWEARALLEAFEIAHSHWSGQYGCFVWSVAGKDELPVKRLRPQKSPLPTEEEDAESAYRRYEVVRRFAAQREEYYDIGYKDGREGRPHKIPEIYARPVPPT